MGDSKDMLWFQRRVTPDYIMCVPAGKWHNIVNTGCTPLKLYSIYAPLNTPTELSIRLKMMIYTICIIDF